MNVIQQHLQALGACEKSIEWAATQNDPLTAWRICKCGDWLLWLAGRLGVKREILLMATCACARLALPYTTDERPLRAIEIAEQWACGDPRPSLDMVMKAAEAAVCAAHAYDTARAADAYDTARAADAYDTARAAVCAAYAAAYAVCPAYAYDATYAARVAAEAAAHATKAARVARVASRAVTLRQCADIVRSKIDENNIMTLWNKYVMRLKP